MLQIKIIALKSNYFLDKIERWCEQRDLNPHAILHTPLKRACLPVPACSHKHNANYIVFWQKRKEKKIKNAR